jgi:hypothetical protein
MKFTDEELLKMNQKKPSAPDLPVNDVAHGSMEKGRIKGKSNKYNKSESQKKALENLDQMVKSIYDADIPGMCGFMPPPPPNSKSEGNIGYLQGACT